MKRYLYKRFVKIPRMRKFHTMIHVIDSPYKLNFSSCMLQSQSTAQICYLVDHASRLGIGLGLPLVDILFKVGHFKDLNGYEK